MSQLTLSITTVGDLLLDRKITRNEEGNAIMNNIQLEVPEYQRPYKWTARNAIQLLDDIIEARNQNKEVYRVGTLILYRKNKNDGTFGYQIVDGQQRTITFSLLLYALYENEPEDKRRTISFLKQNIFDNENSRRNIPNNLMAFRRRLGFRSKDDYSAFNHKKKMQDLREFIEKQCELVVVITDDISEAFQFFDSQNARGKSLYPHDLLKAYHLREMSDVEPVVTEKVVKNWEKLRQDELAEFFGEYLYKLREWINGEWAETLNENNIFKFKGIRRNDRTPYAQFYKSAFSYANLINTSAMPFVAGTREVNAFQLNTPIIAGKPFFDFTRHYYEILHDIRDNSKYEGFYIQDNEIVKTLDEYFQNGTGNRIARFLFDTALLLYVDRFCPATFPTKLDTELFEQFVRFAFVWAYSLRAQYRNLGWKSAQNYILGYSLKDRGYVNSMNIYKLIITSDTPESLLSRMADFLSPLTMEIINHARVKNNQGEVRDEIDDKGIHSSYLYYLREFNFLK